MIRNPTFEAEEGDEIRNLNVIVAALLVLVAVCAIGKLIAVKIRCIPSTYLICFVTALLICHILRLTAARWQIKEALDPLTTTKSGSINEIIAPPIIFFYTGYSFNIKVLKQSFIQIIILGLCANLLQVILLYSLLEFLELINDLSGYCLLFVCVICMPYTTTNSIEILRKSTVHMRHVEQILESEAFTTTLMAIVLFNYMNLWFGLPKTTTVSSIIVKTFIQTAIDVICCLIPIILGLIGISLMVHHSDGSVLISFSIGALYISICTVMVLMKSAIEPACVVLGIIIGRIKCRLEKRAESQSDSFWSHIFYSVEIGVMFICSRKVTVRHMDAFNDWLTASIVCAISIILRGLNWTLCYFTMKFFFGFSLPRKVIIICVIAPYKTTPPLLMVTEIITNKFLLEDKIQSIITLMVCLHCLISFILFPILCRYIGLDNISDRRWSKINDIIKKLINRKRETTQTCKYDPMMANSNWAQIENLTKIEMPMFSSQNKVKHLRRNKQTLDVRMKIRPASILKKEEFSDLDVDSEFDPVSSSSELESEDYLDYNDPDIHRKNIIRKQILESEMISYDRQLDEGIISSITHRYVSDIERKPTYREIWKQKKTKEHIYNTYNNLIRKLMKRHHNLKMRKPKNWIRFKIFKVINSTIYQYIIATVITLDIISQTTLVVLYFLNRREHSHNLANALQIADFACYSLFLWIFLIHTIGWGCGQYFKQKIWIVEFSVSVIIRSLEVTLILYYYYFINNKQFDILQVNDKIILIKLSFLIRLVMLDIFLRRNCYYICGKGLYAWRNKTILRDYEKRYSIEIGYYDFLQNYNVIFEIKQPDIEVKKNWIRRRNINNNKMQVLEKHNKRVGTTMKSKTVATQVLKSIELYRNELAHHGFVNEVEKWIFKKLIHKKLNIIRTLNNVEIPQPKNLISDIDWLRGDLALENYLIKHAKTVVFEKNYSIVIHNEEMTNLFLIISGVCRYKYKPLSKTLYKLFLKGILPNSDHYLHLRFEEVQRDLLGAGDLIGEFGLITGRAYRTEVVCLDKVTAIKIPFNAFTKHLFKCYFGKIRLSKIWKSFGIQFALKFYPRYFNVSSGEEFMLQLHGSFVPILDEFQIIKISDKISDIILIEGTAIDPLTGYQYFAPEYIEQHSKVLIVNRDLDIYKVPTRLLLVPKLGINETDFYTTNKLFEPFINYSKLKMESNDRTTCIKNKRKLKVLKKFMEKYRKYFIDDFVMQKNNPRVSLPCCNSEDIRKHRKEEEIV